MVEKTLKDYILTAKKEYHYRVKTAFEMTEDRVKQIEKACYKYGLVEMSKPTKLPIQSNPLDFKNVENVEVYYLDITTDYPAMTEMFHQELRQALCVAEKLVIVRCADDPYEKEAAKINAFNETEKDGKYVTKLEDPEYKSDGQTDVNKDLYSEEYKQDFLKTLSDVRKEEKQRITNSKNVGDAEDYNADVKKGKGNKSPFNDIKLEKMPEA